MTNGTRTVTKSPYAGLRHRDYFHIMLNLDSFEGFLPTARALAEGFLDAARKLQKSSTLEAELRVFPYSRAAFEARLDEVYQGLVEDTNRYEAAQSWTMRTRENVIDWLLQMAPFNQTDGAWLRNIAPVGPMDLVRNLLFGIWIEELGGGDPALNHANIYTELLRDVDIVLPELRSREYAENPDILDSAYTAALFQLVVSEFSQDFLPELLGMTQYLEWSSVELKNMVRLNEYFGLDAHFYEMHVAIDNAATGHGAKARQAIESYLEQVRVDAGDEAMQAQWERIWNGYVAFSTTGTLAEDMQVKLAQAPTPADRVEAIIRTLGPKARLNHGLKKLAGTLINDRFAEPTALMKALIDAALIVPGDQASPFFDLMGPEGPMYKVFTDEQIKVWRGWVGSVAAGPAKPPRATLSIADQMARLVDAMRARQQDTHGHQAEMLTGPDTAGAGQPVSKPVSWWFTQPTAAFLAVVADRQNGWVVPGDSAASKLVSDLLNGKNRMSKSFNGPALNGPALNGPGGDGPGKTWRDVAVAWIDGGCPMPGDDQARPLSLLSPPERVTAHPTGKVHGSGSVH